MRIAIFGAGGVGGYFGGRLAQAGEEVSFIARGRHLRALQENGLRVESIEGDFALHPVRATDDPAVVGQVDAVLVAVKAWQVPAAAEAMQPLVGAATFIVPLENGVEAPAQLAAVLGASHVLGGLCRISSFIAAPGRVRHVAIEPYVAFGEMDGRHDGERVERLRAAFARTRGVTVEIPADIEVAMWRKFLLIAPWSGLGAVTRAPIGVLRSQPGMRHLLRQAMEEVVAIGQARGIALPAAAVGETLAFIDNLAPETTASMQRDVIAGHPSELEAQNGAVVRLGEEAGIATPVNAFIYHSLLPLELRARGELHFVE